MRFSQLKAGKLYVFSKNISKLERFRYRRMVNGEVDLDSRYYQRHMVKSGEILMCVNPDYMWADYGISGAVFLHNTEMIFIPENDVTSYFDIVK